MPFSRISAAVSGRAVTCVTSSRSITSIVTCSGVPRRRTSPPLTSRMFSSVCVPGTVSGGTVNGVFGRIDSSRGVVKLGPRNVARISASGANGERPSGSVGACR